MQMPSKGRLISSSSSLSKPPSSIDPIHHQPQNENGSTSMEFMTNIQSHSMNRNANNNLQSLSEQQYSILPEKYNYSSSAIPFRESKAVITSTSIQPHQHSTSSDIISSRLVHQRNVNNNNPSHNLRHRNQPPPNGNFNNLFRSETTTPFSSIQNIQNVNSYSSYTDVANSSVKENNIEASIQSKIKALSKASEKQNGSKICSNSFTKDGPRSSPRRHTLHVDDPKRLRPSTCKTSSDDKTQPYPIPVLSPTTIEVVQRLSDKYVATSKRNNNRKVSTAFVAKFVEIERKKRQMKDMNQHKEMQLEMSKNAKEEKENAVVKKLSRELEERLESISQKLSFLEKQSHRDKELIQFYRNRERHFTGGKPSKALTSSLLSSSNSSMNNIHLAVNNLFEQPVVDPFDLTKMSPPKGVSFQSIVYYWKVFCKITYVCRFVLAREH
ncbi:hypothetical protein C9374_010705 [Naegleria lovaniensis]|uniref:Uncharacterized protein n=1 Tax=Naegleria lovaniensis TaxID=51637 RepID=A0AA88KFV5_NAELO|nr:uncharacterized protein C9374_010705 [Naegleria lovaniensis]KAG2374421.1 hypothetical protein C9374_010705 [Naegleria lovaniensis]